VASAFGSFCDRWSWGVRALVQDGNQFAERLGLSAGLYNDVENQVTGAIKELVVAGVGDGPGARGHQTGSQRLQSAGRRLQPRGECVQRSSAVGAESRELAEPAWSVQ
jgi:hypothetical protein